MKIVIIGAGNVGYHLGIKLHQVGEEVVQVFSRKHQKASKLAQEINTVPISSLAQISQEADLYILSVHDSAIKEVAAQLPVQGVSGKLIAHTSGSTPISIFEGTGISRYGVFYPLQTFSISKKPDFNNIPFCIDANNSDDLNLLIKLASRISQNVNKINDRQRAMLHIAAVFVNNFSNHLFHIGNHLLEQEGMDMDLLLPLIQETVNKIKNNKPKNMQTGPALRNDESTLDKHLEMLEKYPGYQKIYRLLTKSIQREQ